MWEWKNFKNKNLVYSKILRWTKMKINKNKLAMMIIYMKFQSIWMLTM